MIDELGKLALFSNSGKLVEDEVGAVLIGHGHLPADVVRAARTGESFRSLGSAFENHFVRLVLPGAVASHEVGRACLRRDRASARPGP